MLAKVERFLNGRMDKPATMHCVRDVAPNKHMLCVSFQLPAAVAFAGRASSGAVGCGAGGDALAGDAQGSAGAEAGIDSADVQQDGQPAAAKRQKTDA